MKRHLLQGIAIVALFAGPAIAQPAPPPAYDWTGFYVGADVGGAWSRDRVTETTTTISPPQTGSATLSASGVVGGLLAGYNWQSGHLVLGVEGDGEWTGLSRTSHCLTQDAGVGNASPGSCFSATTYDFDSKLTWQASARARIGIANDNMLVYATGGVAFAGVKTDYATLSGVTGAESSATP